MFESAALLEQKLIVLLDTRTPTVSGRRICMMRNMPIEETMVHDTFHKWFFSETTRRHLLSRNSLLCLIHVRRPFLVGVYV